MKKSKGCAWRRMHYALRFPGKVTNKKLEYLRFRHSIAVRQAKPNSLPALLEVAIARNDSIFSNRGRTLYRLVDGACAGNWMFQLSLIQTVGEFRR